jgi:hypothetical protein
MNKLILIAFAMASFAAAQTTQQGPVQSSNEAGNNNTVRVCITESNGTFTLTDSLTGTIYKLTGNTEGLNKKIGHEVDIVGQLTAAPGGDSKTDSSAAPNSVLGPNNGPSLTALQVNSVNEVADHCRNRDASPSPGSSNGKNWATFNITHPTSPETASTAQESSMAETTSSFPILGLLGIGALVAGLMVRK